jgi:hypothetical protein
VLLSPLLRTYACRTREQQTNREIAPPRSGDAFVGILLGGIDLS